MPFHVIQDSGWSYVVPLPEKGKAPWFRSGPWRYAWEAQEEADRLNGVRDQSENEQDADK